LMSRIHSRSDLEARFLATRRFIPLLWRHTGVTDRALRSRFGRYGAQWGE
jgi:hypothetical protein